MEGRETIMQNDNKYITFHTDTSGIQITNKSDPFNLDNSVPWVIVQTQHT